VLSVYGLPTQAFTGFKSSGESFEARSRDRLKPAPISNQDQGVNRSGRADEESKLYDRLAQVAAET
jgi:hypothetical protein